MLITKLKSKIAYATVTGKDLFYVGSITIDQNIMEQANIEINEKVQIVNLNNGSRLETYTIAGERGSRAIEINGPAARTCEIGDEIFILSYALINPKTESLTPTLIDFKKEAHYG